MYREEIKVLDCTIRDGGLINKHDFSLDFVRKVYKSCADAGVDYVELGYKNSRDLFDPTAFGAWKFCDDEDLYKVIDGMENKSKISVMADVGRVDMDNIKKADESPVDMIRTACYAKDIDKAIAMNNTFHDLGYETCVNIMAVSRDQGVELDQALAQLEKECQCECVYLVDSFGYFYQENIQHLMKKYKEAMPSKEIGYHGHNNQQLAFSNTIECIIQGGNYMDATIYGIGRGAGNCTLELLLGFLKNPKYDIRPILDIISSDFLDMRKAMEWGYIIPYAIGGMLNEHPNAAIAIREGDKKDDYRAFYEASISADLD